MAFSGFYVPLSISMSRGYTRAVFEKSFGMRIAFIQLTSEAGLVETWYGMSTSQDLAEVVTLRPADAMLQR